jgi:hypothetical protein
MSDEKTLGFNEEKTPSGNGQPENDVDTTEIDSEIDKTLSVPDEEISIESNDEETIVLPKKKVEKLLEANKNYKEGLKSVKEKIKGLKKPVEKPKESPKPKPGDEPLTRNEFQKINERKAIQEACKDQEVDKNWAQIVKFYRPDSGRETPEAILADINVAIEHWRVKNPKKDEDTEDKETTANLASEKGKPEGEQGKGKKPEPKKLFPTQTPVKEWYK